MTILNGKVALVTGGSRGIGAAIAVRLAEDGADVALTYVRGEREAHAVVARIEALGRRTLALRADSAEPDEVERAVAETVQTLGRLDVLVNGAGVFPHGPLEEVTRETLDRTLAIHARAPFVAAQAAARHLPKGGRIISLGSVLGERVPWPGLSLYAMSKAALVGLTKGLARDLGPRGISVVLVQPGPVDTDMNPAHGPGAERQRATVALGRYGKAEEIASAVAYLARPESAFITGSVLTVDGGAIA